MNLRCMLCKGVGGFAGQYPPIFHFGRPEAPIALFSINPSHREFKKLASKPAPFEAWKNADRGRATLEDVRRHETRQSEYFDTGHFYARWFNPVEGFLNSITTAQWGRLSFGLGSLTPNVVHLDIVKCATNPVWSKLSREERGLYVSNCSAYLRDQLMSPELYVLLVNGKSVHDALVNALKEQGFRLEDQTGPKLERHKVSGEVHGTFQLYRYRVVDPSTKRAWLLTGTSQRVSPDDQGAFRNPSDRLRAAQLIMNYINDFAE